MQKLYLVVKQKSEPWQTPKMRMKNPEKWQTLGKINSENPEFHIN